MNMAFINIAVIMVGLQQNSILKKLVADLSLDNSILITREGNVPRAVPVGE
ncbi:hypothetical protein ACFLTQ_01740 [Chloroflexota bacterium]